MIRIPMVVGVGVWAGSNTNQFRASLMTGRVLPRSTDLSRIEGLSFSYLYEDEHQEEDENGVCAEESGF